MSGARPQTQTLAKLPLTLTFAPYSHIDLFIFHYLQTKLWQSDAVKYDNFHPTANENPIFAANGEQIMPRPSVLSQVWEM